VYWGNALLERKSALFTATLYCQSIQAFKKGEKPASILQKYIEAILNHFGIANQCAGSATDAGSDAKSATAGAAAASLLWVLAEVRPGACHISCIGYLSPPPLPPFFVCALHSFEKNKYLFCAP